LEKLVHFENLTASGATGAIRLIAITR
jgi:hypothetical protein